LKQLYHHIALQIEQISAVVSLVGIVAVVLAGIGIVGLVAFSVSQRTKEMAIRLALGATKRKLCAALLQQFTWPILVGLSAGTVLAAFASRFLRVALFGVSNLDPFGYAAAIALLLLIIAVAALLPARRALRLDVARALHCE
jgi:ABC-type antimicrobial peptide transport system permease subunit